jgi:anti-sigma factor RsiW
MRCARAQQHLTAAVDREITGRRRRALDAHLDRCPACRRELAATESLLGVLDGLPAEAEVPARLEQSALRRMRLAVAEEEERSSRPRWWHVTIPALAVAATLAMAVGLFWNAAEEPTASRPRPAAEASRMAQGVAPERVARRHVEAPPSEPPPELAARPDLFVSIPMLKNLEKIEHFDAISTTTLDDDTPDGSEPPSNG